MKLAEALIERADIQRAIEQLKSRMKENAKVQEGDEPVEKTEKLYHIYEDLMEKLENIIIKINKTNAAFMIDWKTLAEALTKRDCLKSKISAYKELYTAATIKTSRYSRSEVKYVRFVDMGKLQDTIDSLSKQYRELDTKIQGYNWAVDLIE